MPRVAVRSGPSERAVDCSAQSMPQPCVAMDVDTFVFREPGIWLKARMEVAPPLQLVQVQRVRTLSFEEQQ